MQALIDGASVNAKSSSSNASSIVSQRIHYMDNLRAIAMMLGVLLHSALAYAQPAQSVWLATDTKASVAVDVAIWFIHLFRMGLFFLLAGYFAKLVIERKGVKQFLWGRCLRIVAPFILFYPFLLAAMAVVIIFSLSYLDEPKGLMGLIARAANDNTQPQTPNPPRTMHLWFLYYLMFYTIISVMVYRVQCFRLDAAFRKPVLLVLSPLVLVPGVLAAGNPLPAPESFVPTWWPFAFYGIFYYAGWQVFGREQHLDKLRPFAWRLVAVSMVLFVPYYWLMPVLDLNVLVANEQSPKFWLRLTEAVLTAYLSVLLTIASLLLGQRYLSGESDWLRFVADSSYWVYLLHLPIVIFLQTLLAPLDLSLWLKLIAVVVGTLVACMATYVVFVRYTPIGWLLHGKRSFP